MAETSFISECYVETFFLSVILQTEARNHVHGAPNVLEKIEKKFKNRFAVGWIDKDRVDVKGLKKYNLAAEVKGFNLLYTHPSEKHFIIQIQPAMEMWILRICKMLNISLADFELNIDLDGLKKQTKRPTSKDENNLKRLFKTILRDGKDVEEVSSLVFWLTEFKKKGIMIEKEFYKKD